MRRYLRAGLLTTATAIALVGPALPAHAGTLNAGVNACDYDSTFQPVTSTTHQVSMKACTAADSATIYSTAQITNTGSGATYSVTAQLRRSSDGALIASENCQGYVGGGLTVYCTKAWPRSSATVYTVAVATRSPLTTQAIVTGNHYTT